MNDSTELSTIQEAEAFLRELFQRNGYVRVPNEKRRQEVGSQKYKKGYEVRLVANSEEELEEIRQALRQLGFRPARPFQKHRQIVQPVYGKQAVEWFLSSADVTRR
ncbi:MAG: hypothetical protein D6791_02890 [Chloroflexi bacterium]|nr:MAG: hypothetical protein D6791_02890 [Chloroflexota bacterium]